VDSVAAVDLVAVATAVLAAGMEPAIGNGATRIRGLNSQQIDRVALVHRNCIRNNPKTVGAQSKPRRDRAIRE